MDLWVGNNFRFLAEAHTQVRMPLKGGGRSFHDYRGKVTPFSRSHQRFWTQKCGL